MTSIFCRFHLIQSNRNQKSNRMLLRKQINLFSSHFFSSYSFFSSSICNSIVHKFVPYNFIDARCNFTNCTASYSIANCLPVYMFIANCKLREVNVMLRSVAILSFPRSLPPIKLVLCTHTYMHAHVLVCYTQNMKSYNRSCWVNIWAGVWKTRAATTASWQHK